MKSKTLKILFLIFIFLLIIQFSFAQRYTVNDVIKSLRIPDRPLDILFGLTPDQPIEIAIIWLIILIMLFFAFSDIFNLFTGFSTRTSYILGFGLAMIAAMTRAVLWFSVWIFGKLAMFGVFSILIVLGAAFVAFTILHLLTGGKAQGIMRWAVKRRIASKALKEAGEPAEAWKKLEEFAGLTK